MLDCKIGDILLNLETNVKFRVAQIFTFAEPIYYCESINVKSQPTFIEVVYSSSKNYKLLPSFNEELEDL